MFKRILNTISSLTVVLAVLAMPARPALALDGPKDAVALVVTASLISVAAHSGWTWFHAGDPDTLVNRLSQIHGKDSWIAWYADKSGQIFVGLGFLSTGMMLSHCTSVGIASVDRWLGLVPPQPLTPTLDLPK